ncbi:MULTISPECIES: aspartate/glutamate racemase family protein [unclassified Ruegeria]|uniref:aspartate/glutamate racemase family protein n=1 Tax=unclassified Ruegeria TaxID=2625375 RepID=UPI001492A038|nr:MULTISPECIES: aspartate/glutamate racemase family protein [unclassified Ruegeria]NOD90699.1 Asp/Glu racemase [Ruegeria sp. HKCCD4318]NOE15798.1 Asp/Glu racemase [Ruegeria sp. HKCCD4318-2]NOG07929.1 Asp/Glu racemase [Ruegeria sp. HKCCD4315]
MKKIGILGGVGWASTVDYYRAIAEGAGRHFAQLGHSSPLPVPPITIESVTQAKTRALRGVAGDEASWAEFDNVFRDALLTLERAGCDFGIIASNTPHARLHAIRQGVSMPILSIFDATADATASTGASEALVLGTSVTMQATNYADRLAAEGITANNRLPEPEITEMQAMIDSDFYGGASDTARTRLLAFCNKHAANGTAILLACTELPLAFPAHLDDPVFEAEGHLFVNPSAAHVSAALKEALG